MGDRLGIPGAVDFCFFHLAFSSSNTDPFSSLHSSSSSGPVTHFPFPPARPRRRPILSTYTNVLCTHAHPDARTSLDATLSHTFGSPTIRPLTCLHTCSILIHIYLHFQFYTTLSSSFTPTFRIHRHIGRRRAHANISSVRPSRLQTSFRHACI
jgi:hypothetical protein